MEMHATELRLRNQQPTARELGRQYRENVRAQDLLTAKQMETENTVRRMAENVGAQVAFDATISDAAGHNARLPEAGKPIWKRTGSLWNWEK